jgi:hypothetical protein
MAPLAGGTEVSLSPTEPASFSPTLGPGPVALAGGFLYYINNAADWIRKVPVGGGAVSSVAGEQSGLGQLAVDATSVYWTSQGIPGTVMKAPR